MYTFDEKAKKEFGKRLRKLRENKRLTQEEMKDEWCKRYSSISTKTISRYENGKNLPKIDQLLDIADFFGVSLDYMVYGTQTSDDNSFTWADTIKRLNRLIFCTALQPHKKNGVYVLVVQEEALNVYLDKLCAFMDSAQMCAPSSVHIPIVSIDAYDKLIEDFGKLPDPPHPSLERMKRQNQFLQKKLKE